MTENSIKYKFEQFTFKNYRTILENAKLNYSFITYDKVNLESKDFILLRHDVDHSMHNALKMATIEHELNIVSTYFIHLHNEFYNFFEKEISEIILKIIELGHEVGLHFDVHYHHINTEEELNELIQFEKSLLEKVINRNVKVFSFHNTNEFTMNCKEWSYGGLINTYANIFQSEVGYCSDSNGYWRFEVLQEIIMQKKYTKLQVLTHPELWQEQVMSPKQRIYHCADVNADRIKRIYDEHLIEYKRENVDW